MKILTDPILQQKSGSPAQCESGTLNPTEARVHAGAGIFVTGTDTSVGKTVVCSLLLSALHTAGKNASYFKPVQTGSELDRDAVSRWTGIDLSQMPEPVYSFSAPMAPSRAYKVASSEGLSESTALNSSQMGQSISQSQGVSPETSGPIQLASICDRYRELTDFSSGQKITSREDLADGARVHHWIVEGCGGLLVPLNQKDSIGDLAVALGLPLLVVASTRLGTINHTLLTLEAAKARGLVVAGIVLVGETDLGLKEELLDLSGVPVLAEVEVLRFLNSSESKFEAQTGWLSEEFSNIHDPVVEFQRAAKQIFTPVVLEKIFSGRLTEQVN